MSSSRHRHALRNHGCLREYITQIHLHSKLEIATNKNDDTDPAEDWAQSLTIEAAPVVLRPRSTEQCVRLLLVLERQRLLLPTAVKVADAVSVP